MIINDITEKQITAPGTILPFKKNGFFPIKINKSIEIVIVPNLGNVNNHQDNVGIILEEKKIFKILSKRYKNVSITEVNSKEDLLKIEKYPNADFLLFDYKPTEEELPGGNAKRFSWDLVKDIKTYKPWFLSGGININNINEIKNYAIPYGIDISSGVEEKLGIKSSQKITKLLEIFNA